LGGISHTFVPVDPQPPGYDLGGFNDEFLVDVTSEPVPGIPPHLWGSSESVIVSENRPREQKQQAQIVVDWIAQFHGGRYGEVQTTQVVLYMWRVTAAAWKMSRGDG